MNHCPNSLSERWCVLLIKPLVELLIWFFVCPSVPKPQPSISAHVGYKLIHVQLSTFVRQGQRWIRRCLWSLDNVSGSALIFTTVWHVPLFFPCLTILGDLPGQKCQFFWGAWPKNLRVGHGVWTKTWWVRTEDKSSIFPHIAFIVICTKVRHRAKLIKMCTFRARLATSAPFYHSQYGTSLGCARNKALYRLSPSYDLGCPIRLLSQESCNDPAAQLLKQTWRSKKRSLTSRSMWWPRHGPPPVWHGCLTQEGWFLSFLGRFFQ